MNYDLFSKSENCIYRIDHYTLGAEPPRYELLGHGLRVFFKALESALIERPKTPNRHGGGIDGGLAEKIVELIRADDTITVSAIAESLEIPKRTIEREMKKLRDKGHILRVGGNRYGHWEVK